MFALYAIAWSVDAWSATASRVPLPAGRGTILMRRLLFESKGQGIDSFNDIIVN